MPLTGTVVYGPGDAVSGSDLRDGTVHALDAQGREVNTGVYAGSGQDGWRVDTSEYDTFGNTIRSLSAANRDRALNPAGYAAELTDLGLDGKTSEQVAAALDTRSFYSSDGVDLLDTFGPAHRAALPDATTDTVRAHTHTDYGAVDYPTSTPADWQTDAPVHAPAATTTGASRSLDPVATNDTDTETTRYSYALSASPAGGADKAGWNLRTPLETTVENGASDIVSVVVYDADGNLVEQRQPSANSKSDPGTRVTVYYTADGSAPDAACRNKPAWHGQVCTVEPGAQPATSGMPGLPVTTYGYDALLRPTTVTETVTPAGGGTSTRTTTTTYGNAGASGRTDTVTVSGGDGATVPVTSYGYATGTGLPTTITAAGKTLTTGYDDFGQVVSYTDADGAATTTERDNQDRISRTIWTDTDGVSVRGQIEYAYLPKGSGGDHRGLLATLTDSTLGAISAGYDPSGNLVSQTLPGGLRQSLVRDTTGATTATTWTDASDTVLLADRQTSDVHGRWAREDLSGAHPGWTGRDYDYDHAGRLTRVAEDHQRLGCQTRAYTFDVNSNRTQRDTYPADAAGDCATSTTPEAQTLSYDNADRLTPTGPAAGTGYDPWGRITTLPAALTATPGGGDATLAYYGDDLAHSITQDSKTRTWTRDVAGRLAAMTTSGLGSTASTSHYGDTSSDSPAWTRDTDTTGAVTLHRYLTGLAGNLLADLATTSDATTVTIQLVGLHGDVLRTTSPTPTDHAPDGPGIDTDEYGQIRDTTTGTLTTGPRYAWLGGKQRPTDTGATGVTLMGVRLYTPVAGMFLQTDPVYGGGTTSYGYPSNPVAQFDLSGRCWGWGCEWIEDHLDEIVILASIVAVVASGPVGWTAVGISIAGGLMLAKRDWDRGDKGGAILGVVGSLIAGGAARSAFRLARAERSLSQVNRYHGSTAVFKQAQASARSRVKKMLRSHRRWSKADTAFTGYAAVQFARLRRDKKGHAW